MMDYEDELSGGQGRSTESVRADGMGCALITALIFLALALSTIHGCAAWRGGLSENPIRDAIR